MTLAMEIQFLQDHEYLGIEILDMLMHDFFCVMLIAIFSSLCKFEMCTTFGEQKDEMRAAIEGGMSACITLSAAEKGLLEVNHVGVGHEHNGAYTGYVLMLNHQVPTNILEG